MNIRVVIAEDQAMVRGAFAALLAIEGDIEIAGEAQDGRAALDLVAKLMPDVVLTDIEMPEVTGLELAAEFEAAPSAGARRHPHYVRARRLPAPRARRGGLGLPAEGRAGVYARERDPPHSGGRPGDDPSLRPKPGRKPTR